MKTDKDIILTGPPRSGTTLACHLLNKLPQTIALHEPMRLAMFPDQVTGLASVRAFFPEMRRTLLAEGKALSRISRNEIPDNPFPSGGTGPRQSIVHKDWIHFDKPLDSGFDLVLKHNAHFTFLLPQLVAHYPCYVVIRHPVAVIASWNTIVAPVARGELLVLPGLRPDLQSRLEKTPDVLDRQVMLLHFLFEAYEEIPDEVILRYEDIVSSGGRSLSTITPRASVLQEPLKNKNQSPLYDQARTEAIRERLIRYGGAYLRHYPKEILEAY